MSEHTKGELEVSSYRRRDIWIGADKNIATCHIHNNREEAEANAAHLVHCWNNFDAAEKERDDLRDVCEAADLALNICAKHLLGTGSIPEPEALALTIIQIKQALAGVKK